MCQDAATTTAFAIGSENNGVKRYNRSNEIHTYLTTSHRGFSGPMKQSTKRQNTTTTTTGKNPNWPEANQLALYKCSQEIEPETTWNK